MEVISRKDALALGLKFYFTGKPCKREHVAQRYANNGVCEVCAQEYRDSNRESSAIYFKDRYLRTKEIHNKRSLQNYYSNREKRLEQMKLYGLANRAKLSEYSSFYRAKRTKSTPVWQTHEDRRNIRAVYKMAKRLSKCLGVEHHVDHIVPLKGESVCGLHVPWNLQAIPAKLNLSKSNKLLLEEPS